MFTFSLAEAFIALFIGMGPIKVLLVYIAKTQNMEEDVRRRVARRIAVVAAAVAIGLFILGAVLQQILHFSI
ncbi:MAG TPA: MarC family protein, partial [Chloroflexi bacterium]|nr:MarC family protein [Chloroflexota bacterium]